MLGRVKRGPWATARLAQQAREISTERESLSELSDHQLNEYLADLGALRRRKPGDWRSSMAPGLAALAVAAERELGLKAHEVQLMAASAVIQGYFTEVDTGEGKTLAIGLAAAFQAWSGRPCHVITANDYPAGRDAKNLHSFYQRVGLTVAAVLGEDADEKRRTAYQCGITYTTAQVAAADSLRDQLHTTGVELRPARLLAVVAGQSGGTSPVQRGLHATLIDEAVTPLIISRTLDADEMERVATAALTLVSGFELGIHHRLDRARQVVEAREIFPRDEQYVVDDGKVFIVDPATGRPMAMRTWQQGLHQVIEANEGLTVTGATETLARISFQAYFQKHTALAGASSTLRKAASELWHTYHAPFVTIPRNIACQHHSAATRFCATAGQQQAALLYEIKSRHARGQPSPLTATAA